MSKPLQLANARFSSAPTAEAGPCYLGRFGHPFTLNDEIVALSLRSLPR